MRLGRQDPRNTSYAKPTAVERLNWYLEKYTQMRSKKVWARYGNKYGLFVFWLILSDVLLMQNVIKYVTRIILFPKRLFGKFRRTLSR
jgi:hypothetical protein